MLGVRDVKDELRGSGLVGSARSSRHNVRVGSHPSNGGIAIPSILLIRRGWLVLVRACALCGTAFIGLHEYPAYVVSRNIRRVFAGQLAPCADLRMASGLFELETLLSVPNAWKPACRQAIRCMLHESIVGIATPTVGWRQRYSSYHILG